MMLLADTDVLIDLARLYLPALQWQAALVKPLAIPGFVLMELIAGCRSKAQLQNVQALVSSHQIVWPTEQDCQYALAVFSLYYLSHNLGLIDSFIAAIAAGRGATLCTFNIKHFQVIPGLIMEQSYAKAP